ncbi:putative acetyltransferase [Motilibacter rhizosphaerae]|uniref:Putative acetyltransferase n=1 Tax=Motilibacter rhizosphaerae TaxID=598652 RepID=A0A4Q7NB03_9ACTN|nr:GNAT family N-acetyltransferase [Motilibacter rhizosphaerae]RZS79990.1 putative acetyltransferase [Motilibacter rhizosphaerae]
MSAQTVVVLPGHPSEPDVAALLEAHAGFCAQHSPPEDVHVLAAPRLAAEDVTFRCAREDGRLLGVGALRHLDAETAELKSMHTAAAARGRGVARTVLTDLLAIARSRGYRRVYLETGSMEAFAPARALYASAGFVACEPFADYAPSVNSSFFTLALD